MGAQQQAESTPDISQFVSDVAPRATDISLWLRQKSYELRGRQRPLDALRAIAEMRDVLSNLGYAVIDPDEEPNGLIIACHDAVAHAMERALESTPSEASVAAKIVNMAWQLLPADFDGLMIAMARAHENEDASGALSYTLGRTHFYGVAVERDLELAYAQYERAAEKGHVNAMFELYAMNARGIGKDKDMLEAAHWCMAAARAGHAGAMANIGAFYAAGLGGVELDKGESLRWYQEAAEAGHGRAAAAAAIAFALGIEVEADPILAQRYFAIAERVGCDWKTQARHVGLDPSHYIAVA